MSAVTITGVPRVTLLCISANRMVSVQRKQDNSCSSCVPLVFLVL